MAADGPEVEGLGADVPLGLHVVPRREELLLVDELWLDELDERQNCLEVHLLLAQSLRLVTNLDVEISRVEATLR